MNDIITVAQSTSSRVLRMKSLYFLIAAAIAIMATGPLYGAISAGLERQYTLDLSFALLSIIGLLCALVACFELPRELKDQTALTVLSKPLGRDRYLVGKWVGICWIALVAMALGTVGLLLVNAQSGDLQSPVEILKGAALQYAGVMQLAALGVLLGLLLSEWVAAIAVVAVLWLSHLIGGVLHASAGSGSAMELPARVVYYVLPNLTVTDVEGMVVRDVTIAPAQIGLALALAVAWSAAILLVAGLLFRQRDIT